MISRLLHHLMLIKIKRNKMQNPYLSYKARIRGVKEETPDVKTFQLEPGKFGYMPGQFLELSILGAGEAPISITSSPTRGDLEIAVKRMGRVTGALHELEAGDHVWIRNRFCWRRNWHCTAEVPDKLHDRQKKFWEDVYTLRGKNPQRLGF